MINSIIKTFIIYGLIVRTYSNLIVSNNNNDITYWTIGPKSYICMCTPNSVLVKNPKLNATVWDTYCSNQKQCIWNNDEIIVKTWYEPN